jgi:hypothetical protein
MGREAGHVGIDRATCIPHPRTCTREKTLASSEGESAMMSASAAETAELNVALKI